MTIVCIDIDSLRPDHLGCYGYEAPTSPHIDEFAGDAARFDRYYAANSPCMPSRAGFLSGRYGVHNGVVTHGPRGQVIQTPHTREDLSGPREDWFTLPEAFFEDHREAVAISSFPRHPAPWFYHVWDRFHQPREPRQADGNPEYFQTPRAADVADRALDELERLDADAVSDYFLYVQFWDPHLPYNRSDDEIDRFRGETPVPPYPTEEDIDIHRQWDAIHSASGFEVATKADLLELLATYDAEIRYVDRHVGRVLQRVRELGTYDDTLIVVTADHAEEFGEKGVYSCHWSVYEGTQRIPLLIKPPAREHVEPGHRDHLVTNVDLPRTILDFADLDVPASWQGRSMRPILDDDEAEWRDFVVLEHGYVTAQRAIRTDAWKLVRTYHPGMWPSVVPETELYRLEDDPWEQENLLDDHPGVGEELGAKMTAWVDRHIGPGGDPLLDVAREGPGLYNDHKANHEGV